MVIDQPVAAVAAILTLGVGAQWVAWRFQVPSILLLLGVGFALGPGMQVLDPDRVFGDLLLPFVSAAVAVILFEGGLSLRPTELRRAGRTVHAMVSVGAAVTWGIAAVAARLLLDLDWGMSILLGAILVVTGPTVIGPLLRHIRPTGAAAGILRWEGILIDPIGAILAVLTFEAIVAGNAREATAVVAGGVLATAGVGFAIGLAGAAFMVLVMRYYLIPDFLHNAVSLALVVGLFTLANEIRHEAGLLAVTVMGIALATQRLVPVHHLLEFKEHLRVLLLSGLFVVLAARLDRSALALLGVEAALFVAVLIVIARPLAVAASTARSKLPWRERVFLGWVAPRGIVAAAVASIFALRLAEEGHHGAELLVPVTFGVIIGSIGFYGLTAPRVARRLGIAKPDPQGVLIVGAHPWARAVAAALREEDVRVLLADTDPQNVSAARMEGFEAFYGSVLSEDAYEDIDLGGIGRMLAVTPNDEVNALAAQGFSAVLGRGHVYQVAPKEAARRRHALAAHLRGRVLFGDDETHARLTERYTGGARPKATRLSEKFDFEAFRNHHGGEVLPLFVVSETGRLAVLSSDSKRVPKPGEKVIAFVSPAAADNGETRR